MQFSNGKDLEVVATTSVTDPPERITTESSHVLIIDLPVSNPGDGYSVTAVPLPTLGRGLPRPAERHGRYRSADPANSPGAEPVGTCPPVLGLEVMLSEISEALVSDRYRTDWSGRGFVLLKASSKCKRESVPCLPANAKSGKTPT